MTPFEQRARSVVDALVYCAGTYGIDLPIELIRADPLDMPATNEETVSYAMCEWYRLFGGD